MHVAQRATGEEVGRFGGEVGVSPDKPGSIFIFLRGSVEKGRFLKVQFPLKLLSGKSTNPAVCSEALEAGKKPMRAQVFLALASLLRTRALGGVPTPAEQGPALPSSVRQEAHSTVAARREPLPAWEG